MTARAPFDTALFEEARRARRISLGAPLVHVSETGSTNDDALSAAGEGARSGAVFVADTQTRGRGRRGNAWSSPPGENLTFSILLRPELSPERASALSLVSGLAVRAAVQRRVPEEIRIKWPNDVVVGRRKLSGILVESRLRGAGVEAAVIGIGVNVHMTEAPVEIREIATSLALLGDPAPSRELVLADILVELEDRLAVFAARGLAALADELRRNDALAGTRARVGDIEGTASGIDEEGALLLRDDAGTMHAVSSGTVERL